MNPLQQRLARLRRRLRFFVTFHGLCWLLAVTLLTIAGAGWLDWRWHLPSLVRALLLAGGLSGAGLLLWRLLLRPLAAPADDLSLALCIEEHYPALNDALGSTVQFLEHPAKSDQMGSPSLRRRAMQRALRQVQHYDFNRVIHARGLRWAGLALALGCAAAAPLVVFYPAQAVTALRRLSNPFGGPEWPFETQLTLQAASRVGRGEPFEIRGRLHGVIPERVIVTYQFDGQVPLDQPWAVLSDEPGSGSMVARLEPDRVRRSFTFQVRANDYLSPPQRVQVLPPPTLVSLDGRPSPQVRLEFPAYTDLPSLELPDGAGAIEAVLGTEATLRARTDRPLAADGAWIEYRPEQSLQTQPPFVNFALSGALHLLLAPVPAQLDESRTVLSVRFRPWISGAYALRLKDETGLEGTRWFDLRLLADPAPTVNLERPSASLDSLAVLPTADIRVRILAEDPVFALRQVYLEYRCRKDDPPRRLSLHDTSLTIAGHRLLASAAAGGLDFSTLDRLLQVRLKPNHVTLQRRLELAGVKHLDGSALKEGDILTLQACADDFDDVRVDKEPGRSHEVELRIVSVPALETLVNQAQGHIQQELLRLREQQRDALNKADAALKHWRSTGQMRPEELESLIQAEQLQQHIRARVGTRAEEALRGEVARVQQTLTGNHLPRSGTNERMDVLAQELDRVAREELEQIESLLSNARKENELASNPRVPEPNRRGPLDDAVKHQGEVHKTLNDLLALLEPWSQIREIKGEARNILDQQRRLNEQTERLSKEIPLGQRADQLKKEQQAELERLGASQGRQADHLEELLTKMDRMALDKETQAQEKEGQATLKEDEAKNKETEAAKPATLEEEVRQLRAEARADRQQAQSLRQTAQTLREEAKALTAAKQLGRTSSDPQNSVTPDSSLKQAAEEMKSNRLGMAGQLQKSATESLQKMVQALEQRREDELDRLVRQMRQTEAELQKLTEDQERLRKKVQEAGKLGDPVVQKKELERLAREQERLNQRAQELLQQLTRQRAGRAGGELSRAGERMADAQQELERGENSEENQDEALDRLNEAQRELRQAREDNEEHLAREKLAKVADEIKLLMERQEALRQDTSEFHKRLLERKQWERPLVVTLQNRLAKPQHDLSRDTSDLAEKKLAGAKVFARLLEKAAAAMDQAHEQMQKRFKTASNPIDVTAETAADAVIQERQREALRRFEHVLEALKPENRVAQRPMAGDDGQGGGQTAGAPGDAIPPLAQLKALRALQEEINKRTEDFARNNPDPAGYNDRARAELKTLKSDQAEVAQMLDELFRPAPEGGSR